MPTKLKYLIVAMALNVIGASFLWPLNTIYMSQELGKSLSIAGFVLLLNSLSAMCGNLFGGKLFDQIGGYKTIMTGGLIAFSSLVGLNILHTWPFYAIWLVLLGFGSGMIFPAVYAFAGAIWPEGGRRTFNAIYVAQNVGVAVGTALAGVVADFSFDYIFIANLLMFVLFATIIFTQFRGVEVDANVDTSSHNVMEVKNKTIFFAFMSVLIVYFICWFGYVQWQTTIADLTQHLSISLKQYSLIWTVNGLMIVFMQPVIKPVIKMLKGKYVGQLIVGVLLFMIAFYFTSMQTAFSGFLIGMVIMTFGEMFIWPLLPTIAQDIAPKGRTGAYQGLVNSTATVSRAFGPLVGGFIVDVYNMDILFKSIVGLILFSYVFIGLYSILMKRYQRNT
ncbi:MFS transporter [Abyssicoccus albus]|uniref:MFS transporter n=2 Tax=Abyssicoccus albus TaxID=1817405 RepID=A0A3N5CJ04_9BACL|nr:MFS transporter [Abyssicoccus albus]